MNKNTIALIALIALGIVLFGCTQQQPPTNQPKLCTLEAKVCPDGSTVGRSGPNCEFAPCPTTGTTTGAATATEIDNDIKSLDNSVTGLNDNVEQTPDFPIDASEFQ